jgi:hypothetical protein
MITYETYPALFVFQVLFVLAFAGVMVWQTIESINTIEK